MKQLFEKKLRFLFILVLLVSMVEMLPFVMAQEDAENAQNTRWKVISVRAIFFHLFNGRLNAPQGLFFYNPAKELYVADTANDLVGIFTPMGESLFTFGKNCGISEPRAIVVDQQDRIYVCDADSLSSGVKMFNYRGEFQGFFPFNGLDNEKVFCINMNIDDKGNLYFLDQNKLQVLVYSPDYSLKLKFGKKGPGQGQFEALADIAIDHEGFIYVTDQDNRCIPVQVFDQQGRFIRGWGKHDVGLENFSLPAGITVDDKGRVIVADTIKQDIKVFNRMGKLLFNFGGFGVQPGAVLFPTDVAVDEQGLIYVVEKVGRRVQVFRVEEEEVKMAKATSDSTSSLPAEEAEEMAGPAEESPTPDDKEAKPLPPVVTETVAEPHVPVTEPAAEPLPPIIETVQVESIPPLTEAEKAETP